MASFYGLDLFCVSSLLHDSGQQEVKMGYMRDASLTGTLAAKASDRDRISKIPILELFGEQRLLKS